MFVEPARLAELAGREAVQLAQTPFALLLVAHHRAESSGMLLARRGPIEKRILLERGVPVDCRSNLVHETLSRFLVSAGKLSDEASNALLGRSLGQGRLLGDLLLEERIVDAAELQRLLQQNLAKKLFDLFTWRDGEVTFERGDHRSETALRVKVSRLVASGIERFAPQEIVDREVGPLAGTLLARAADIDELLADLRPGEREQALLAALVTPRRLEEVMIALQAPAEDVSRLLWAMALLGAIVPVELRGSAVAKEAPRELPATPAAPAAAAPAPATPARRIEVVRPGGLSPEEAERLRARVERSFASRTEKDPFELLELPEEASTEELRERFAAYARELGPWRFDHPLLREVAAEARELFFAGALAFAKLSDPREREALRIARRARREESVRESRASFFKIETDLLDATVQFRKGMALEDAGKWDMALQQFEFAVDCDPQNGAYRAEAALCRYRLAPTSAATSSLAELREAQRVDPAASEPFLYAGEICAELKRWAEAEVHYRKAAKLLGPDDRRALDALAELGRRKRR